MYTRTTDPATFEPIYCAARLCIFAIIYKINIFVRTY